LPSGDEAHRNATIHLASRGLSGGRSRFLRGVVPHDDPIGPDTLFDEELADRIGATLAESLVDRRRSLPRRVTADLDPQTIVAPERSDDGLYDLTQPCFIRHIVMGGALIEAQR
jgi:hypothetical protein